MTDERPGSAYTCREPGCGTVFDNRALSASRNRNMRNDHERREHLHSPHHTWGCPLSCGPAGQHYDDEALKGHLRRAHNWKGTDTAVAWPGILAEHARRVEAVWRDAEATGVLVPEDDAAEPSEPAAMAESEPVPERRRTDVLAELAELLREWETLQDHLDAAEAEVAAKDVRISELASENASLQGENKTLREGLAVLSDCLASIQAQAGGDRVLEGEPV